MALIACPGCGHRISSLARFCPKCYHSAEIKEKITPDLNVFSKKSSPENVFANETASLEELLQSEFKPSLDEMIVMEGRSYLINGFFDLLDCYAFLTSKRYVLCDASRVHVLFQAGVNDVVHVEELRHFISKKIILTVASGESIQVKSSPHIEWFNALCKPELFAKPSNLSISEQPGGGSGTLNWYYEVSGTTIGPVKENNMVQLIRNNHTILRNTKVWNAALPEWRRAEETILTIYFSDSFPSGEHSIDRRDTKKHFPSLLLTSVRRLFRKFC